MGIAVVLVAALLIVWLVLRARRRSARRNLDMVARLTGHRDYTELEASAALAARAGVAPSQARSHYAFLVQAFGKPAVDVATAMILDGSFDTRFKGQSVEGALNTLSSEVPDPEIQAIVEKVARDLPTSRRGQSDSPPASPLRDQDKPDEDDLPF